MSGTETATRVLDVGCGPGALTAALAERLARPGGIVSSCVWDYGGEMTLLRAFWDAAREVDPDRGAAADEGVVMRWYLRRLGVTDGPFELTARAWAVAGIVP